MRLQIRILKSVCNVVKSVARFTNLFHKLKTLSIYKKKHRRFYFCYYFSVVVKICEVFSSDYLRVYVSFNSLWEVAYLRVIIQLCIRHIDKNETKHRVPGLLWLF